jgi:hypothetical protein
LFANAAGAYQLDINDAAAASRPVQVTVNGIVVRDQALSDTTGGWLNADLRWVEMGRVMLKKGTNT